MSQVDEVERAILDPLVSGACARATGCPPSDGLVTRTGASQAVVREAIGRLTRDGLLDSRQGSGMGTLVAAIRAGDAEAARAVMARHLGALT